MSKDEVSMEVTSKLITKVWNSRAFDFVKLSNIYGVVLGCIWFIFGISVIKWIGLTLVMPMCIFITLSVICMLLASIIDTICMVICTIFLVLYTFCAYNEFIITKRYHFFKKKEYILYWISDAFIV